MHRLRTEQSSPDIKTTATAVVFFMRRAQQHRARMQPVAVLPSHAPHGSKARLIVVPNRRDSWRSHVHRTRFGKHCSSSSYRPAMSGIEGEGPSSLSLGGCKGGSPRTPSIHRLQCGLPGYLILFAPHTFAPHRQLSSSNPPSPLVFLLISTHFTATLGIPFASPILKKHSFKCSSWVEPMDFTSDLHSRLHALYTQ